MSLMSNFFPTTRDVGLHDQESMTTKSMMKRMIVSESRVREENERMEFGRGIPIEKRLGDGFEYAVDCS